MFEEATGGVASRPEGCVIWLSTQSNEPPAGVFKKKLDYARGVRDGRIDDPEFCPVLYEFPRSMIDAQDYLKPEFFYVTNPNLGVSVDERFIARKLKTAGEGGQDSMQVVLSKFLNVEIGQRLASDRWAGADYWERQGTAGLSLPELMRRSEVVTIGIDGGGLDDLFGLTVLGREAITGNWLAWCRAYAGPIVLERRKSQASVFRDFEGDGDLTLIDRFPEDVQAIVSVVCEVEASGKLSSIGVDPERTHKVIYGPLLEAGIGEDLIVGVPQNWRLTGAIALTERKLAEGALWHGSTRLMAYCVGNAKVEVKGNAVTITKQAAGTAKIDPLMALFNSVALMALNPPALQVTGELLIV
jgi:phage terminase large subunit-like protein